MAIRKKKLISRPASFAGDVSSCHASRSPLHQRSLVLKRTSSETTTNNVRDGDCVTEGSVAWHPEVF